MPLMTELVRKYRNLSLQAAGTAKGANYNLFYVHLLNWPKTTKEQILRKFDKPRLEGDEDSSGLSWFEIQKDVRRLKAS